MKMSKLLILFVIILTLAGCQTQSNAPVENNECLYTSFEVIGDAPNFDETPIDVDGLGYVVKIDGKYGIINKYNELIVEPIYDMDYKYPSYQTIQHALVFENGVNQNVYDLYGIDTNKTLEENIIHDIDIIVSAPCIRGSTYYVKIDDGEYVCYRSGFVLDENNVVTGSETRPIQEDDLINDQKDAYVHSVIVPVMKNDTEISDQYCILSPTGKLYGPFSHDDRRTFLAFDYMEDYKKSDYLYDMNLPGHMFISDEDGKYRVHSIDDSKMSEDLFDEFKVISHDAIQVKKDGIVGIINNNMELYWSDQFEDISNIVNGKAYAKINGQWKIIHIEGKEVEEKNSDSSIESVVRFKLGLYSLKYDMTVRDRPSTLGNEVRIIPSGEEIHVDKIVKGDSLNYWAKISDGYICIADNEMDYLTYVE